MPVAGGAAAKYGDRYEGRWTVRCLIDILNGDAERIRLEPPGHLGDGSEFVLYRSPRREFHQVKRQHGRDGRWTLKTLNSQKILPRFRERLLGAGGDDFDDHCYFVSGHAAHPLDELADRARSAQEAAEFRREFIQGTMREHLNELAAYWSGLAEDDIWAALRRIYPETISEPLLERWNSERVGVLVEGHPDNAADALAQFALTSVHQELDANALWGHLLARGFHTRDWTTTATAVTVIARHSDKFVEDADRLAIRGKPIPREEAAIVGARLDAGASVIVLAGARGAGKSGVAAQVVQERRAAGWHVLALRADEHDEFSRPIDVGARLGLDTTPTTALAGVAAGHPSLLLIDQLDAASLSSGRIPQFLDCVEEMRESAAVHRDMKVVLACRSADLEDDPRLGALLTLGGNTMRVDVGLLSQGLVEAAVDSTPFLAEQLTAQQQEMLRLPLHLKLMTEAADHPDIGTFASYEDLCRMFTAQKRAAHA